MKVALDKGEARVIGVLLEKETTTPDQYPLSVNALTAGCNQKTNREPVLNLAESEVQAVVDRLAKQRLVLERSGFGSRVPKYKQLFCNTEFGSLQFNAAERAIVCELLVRGPQTPGELRAHGHRLHPFASLETHLRDMPEIVELRADTGHGTIGDDDSGSRATVR